MGLWGGKAIMFTSKVFNQPEARAKQPEAKWRGRGQ